MNTMESALILVVDDEPANLFLLEGLLGAHGYRTFTASGGTECFEILENNQPDLILLDIMMPKMTGTEVLTTITKHPKWKDIPVIMVSAKTATADIQESLDKGAIDYIKKPFDEIELLARVKVGLRLKANEDQLREMVNTRNEFVRIISHDLRSPFTAIHGFAGILARADNLTPDQKESLQYIIQSVEYSDAYFNKLLSWTMLNHGDLKLDSEALVLRDLFDSVIRVLEHKAREKDIDLQCLIDNTITIEADAAFFRQVISNLLNNALKFTRKGGEVSCFVEKTRAQLAIVISDNGIGMPDGMTPERMFSDSLTATRKGTLGEKGTGIGLSICKKILDAHGYAITFRRNEKGGTDFIIRIDEPGETPG